MSYVLEENSKCKYRDLITLDCILWVVFMINCHKALNIANTINTFQLRLKVINMR